MKTRDVTIVCQFMERRHGYCMSIALQFECYFASNNWYYTFIFQALFSMVFKFTSGSSIIWRAIRQHLSPPHRTEVKVSSSPMARSHSLLQTLVQSLFLLSFSSSNFLHFNDVMLVPKVSLSKSGIDWVKAQIEYLETHWRMRGSSDNQFNCLYLFIFILN